MFFVVCLPKVLVFGKAQTILPKGHAFVNQRDFEDNYSVEQLTLQFFYTHRAYTFSLKVPLSGDFEWIPAKNKSPV